MLIQLVDHTLNSDIGATLNSKNGGAGCISEVTSCKLKKLIQPVLIQFVGRTLLSDNGGTLSSDNGGIGRLSKVTSSKLYKTHSMCVNTVSKLYSFLIQSWYT